MNLHGAVSVGGSAQVTVRSYPKWRSKYYQLMMRQGRKAANVALARRLAVDPYWMWRKQWDYAQLMKVGSHAEGPENGDGVLRTEILTVHFRFPWTGVRRGNHHRGKRLKRWLGGPSFRIRGDDEQAPESEQRFSSRAKWDSLPSAPSG